MIFWSLSKFELNKTAFIFYCFLGRPKEKKIKKKTIDGLGRDFDFFPLVFKVFYTCVSFWLLTHESHDLSLAETIIIFVTSWPIYLFFQSKWSGLKKPSILAKIINNLWICIALNKRYFYLSLKFMCQQPKTNDDIEPLSYNSILHTYF